MDVGLRELLEPFAAAGLWDGAPVSPVGAEDLPAVYRPLLDHGRDMTGTLEGRFGGPLTLRPIAMRTENDVCLRRVVLASGERTVEYGAIRIHLDAFGPAARERILEGRVPLGAILRDEGVEHACRALGFFSVPADALAATGLDAGVSERLYGRVARLSAGDGRVLAEVVEVLPGLEEEGAEEDGGR